MVKIAASSKILQRLVELSASCRGVEAGALLDRLHEFRARTGRRPARPPSPSRSQASVSTMPRADALAQLRGGRVGEGHDEDLLHVELALEQQAQVQAADVPGLAGAGRGLDQVDAVEAAGEDVEFGGGFHARAFGSRSSSTASSSGWKTVVAQRDELAIERVVHAAQRQAVGRVALFAEGVEPASCATRRRLGDTLPLGHVAHADFGKKCSGRCSPSR